MSPRSEKIASRLQVTFVSLFLLAISIPLLMMPFSVDKEISKREQRRLTSLPDFSLQDQSVAELTGKLSDYFNDHFGFRNQILSWANHYKESIFNRSKAKHVILGNEDWLYFNIDGAVLDYVGKFTPSEVELRRWKSGLTLKKRWLESMGIQYAMFVVPSKISVYPQYLPNRFHGLGGKTRVRYFSEYIRDDPSIDYFFNLKSVLTEAAQNRQVYFKTDTHWNDYGAHTAYAEIISSLSNWFTPDQPIPLGRFKTKEIMKKGDIARIGLENRGQREKSELLYLQHPCAGEAETKGKSFAQTPAYKARPGKTPRINGCGSKSLRAILVHDSFGVFLKRFLNEHFKKIAYMTYYDPYGSEQYIKEFAPDIYIDVIVDRRFHLLLDPDSRMEMALEN